MSVAAAALARRRAREDQLRSRMEYVRSTSNARNFALWEQKMSERIEKADVTTMAKELAEKDSTGLASRRKEIKQLYKQEMEQWKEMLSASKAASTELRMERMRDKACRLKAEREAKRIEYVSQCYYRRWRDSCDELRTLDSNAVMAKLMRDRKHAIICKEEQSKVAKQRDDVAAIQERMDFFKLEETDEKDYLKRKNLQFKRSLDEQIKLKNKEKQSMLAARKREEKEMIENWKDEEQKMKERERHHKLESHRRGKEDLAMNMCRLKEKERRRSIEKEHDRLLLMHALDKEQEDITHETEKKTREKAAFLEFMEEAKNEDISAVENIQSAEMDRIWLERDNKMKVQENARQQLLTAINTSRELQVMAQKQKSELEKQEVALQVAAEAERIKMQEGAEREFSMERRARTIENMKANKALVEMRREQNARDAQEDCLDRMRNEHADARDRERLANEVGSVRTYHPLKHTTWYS